MTHPFRPYREESRTNWGTFHVPKAQGLSIEQIQLGALLRIADAVELMAKRYRELHDEVDYLRRRSAQLEAALATERRRSAALRGVVRRRRST